MANTIASKAEGQLPVTKTTAFTATYKCVVKGTFFNTHATVAEQVVVYANFSGTSRKLADVSVDPGGKLVVRAELEVGDYIEHSTTNASRVDFYYSAVEQQ